MYLRIFISLLWMAGVVAEASAFGPGASSQSSGAVRSKPTEGGGSFESNDRSVNSLATASIPVFPGAEGYGAMSFGARGVGTPPPRILYVTTLKDQIYDASSRQMITAPGSLRAALETSGPRFIIFKVGGTIVLDKGIYVDYPYAYVAGQTAPSPGITIAHHGIDIRTNDVVLRYLRFRAYFDDVVDYLQGKYMQCLTIDRVGSHEQIVANLPVDNIMIDHCSFSWSIDDTVGIGEYVRGVTIQWCIVAEGAQYGPEFGPAGLGMLSAVDIGSTAPDRMARVSIHHNLFIHNGGRNPKMTAGFHYDIRNNIVYNWSESSSAQLYCGALFNFVGNFYVGGLDSPWGNPNRKDIIQVTEPGNPTGLTRLFLSGNLAPRRTSLTQSEWDVGVSYYQLNNGAQIELTNAALQGPYALWSPISMPNVTTQPVTSAVTLVLANAGASGLFRDSVDSRLVDEANYACTTLPMNVAGPNYNPNDDPKLHHIGPNDGPVWDVLWLQPQNDPNRVCYPRQSRILPGQSLDDAKLALLSHINCKLPDGISLPRDAQMVLANPTSYQWSVTPRHIPDEAFIQTIYPANLRPQLPRDSDGDGIPDANELQMGTDPTRVDSLQDRNSDGYLNIEEYINSLAN